jgi:biotin carboxylase
MAKVIAKGDDRSAAIENMRRALSAFEISGVQTNIPFLQFLMEQPEFIQGNINIKWVENTVLPKFLKAVPQE